MTHAFDIRTEDMPATMRVLLDEYPRDSWDAHPGFKEKTKHWLGAHQMFRKLGELVRSETELYLDRSREPDDFAGRLSYYGNALVANLHGHHNWEDKSYFPELSAADPRFDRGLEILEKDHQELDRVLDQFTETANRSIKLIHLDEPQVREEAGRLHGLAGTIEAFLDRHLADEEELAVPIILHHRLRG
ncbi:hemerythrin domain-containing protein [Roseibium sp.]|uniref:hemerythrin domain-containing protein n=1 Tax=Roseibium sp. TaxID=1936156 RepID=UPI003BA91F3A